MQQLLQQEKITSSLAAKEKENHLLMPIQSQSESCSYQHSAKKIPHFFGFILCLCLLLHGPVSWFSSSESQNRVWEKIEIAAKPPQNLALQSTELQQTKINLPYDLASGSSVYCNGDPVNGLDPDGRCVESGNAGAQAGWNNGNGNPISYNPSSASNPTAYSLAWGFGRLDSYIYRTGSVKPTVELLNGVSQSINWGLNSTEQALGIPENSLTAAAFVLGPEAVGAVAGLRAWGSLRAGAAVENTSTALSTFRYTSEGETFFHYGYAEHAASFENGLQSGGYATTIEGLTGPEAKSGLSLRHAIPPDAVYKITPNAGSLIRVNPVAEPLFGQPGKLPEVQFPMGTEPGTVSKPNSIYQ